MNVSVSGRREKNRSICVASCIYGPAIVRKTEDLYVHIPVTLVFAHIVAKHRDKLEAKSLGLTVACE